MITQLRQAAIENKRDLNSKRVKIKGNRPIRKCTMLSGVLWDIVVILGEKLKKRNNSLNKYPENSCNSATFSKVNFIESQGISEQKLLIQSRN